MSQIPFFPAALPDLREVAHHWSQTRKVSIRPQSHRHAALQLVKCRVIVLSFLRDGLAGQPVAGGPCPFEAKPLIDFASSMSD